MKQYNHKHSHILPTSFWIHFGKHLGFAAPLLCLSLFIGVAGYHFIEGMEWVDALLNAAMIMSGMGPANDLHTEAGKVFASCYALYSGLFLIAITGYLLIPFFHRLLHTFEKQAEE